METTDLIPFFFQSGPVGYLSEITLKNSLGQSIYSVHQSNCIDFYTTHTSRCLPSLFTEISSLNGHDEMIITTSDTYHIELKGNKISDINTFDPQETYAFDLIKLFKYTNKVH